jgi:ABC-2 type transport system ATP-binding protein
VAQQLGQPALDAVDLTKSYPTGRGKPRVQALAGLSFVARSGSICGLLGPNGAGKSTTVKVLATLTQPDSGVATVAGIDVVQDSARVRRAIGFVAQKSVCDPAATGIENLVLAGRLHAMPRPEAKARARELLERFRLGDAAGRRVSTYSGGMARKLDVAVGLMHRPRVLLLDEPTTGLDPQARADMWAELEAMVVFEELAVLLTTHYLDEADRLASDVAIVDGGRVIAAGTPDQLKSGLHGDAVVIELVAGTPPDDARRAVAATRGLTELVAEGSALRARATDGAAVLPHVLAALERDGVAVASATVARPSLDDVYLRHTGRAFTQEVNAA